MYNDKEGRYEQLSMGHDTLIEKVRNNSLQSASSVSSK